MENNTVNGMEDFSFTYGVAYRFSFLLWLTWVLVSSFLFAYFYSFDQIYEQARETVFRAVITLPVVVLGVFLHEALYALAMLTMAKIPAKDLKWGINWMNVTPFAHCKYAYSLKNYRRAVIFPVLVLGCIPIIAGLVACNYFAVFMGSVFIAISGGDILKIWKIRRVPGNFLADDHPEKAGARVYENPFGE